MRKNLLAKSIATMIGGFAMIGAANAIVVAAPGLNGVLAANTLEVNTDNIGHSLLYPYYTVQGGNYTLFSIVNHDTLNGKAVKIRFRGAENSDDVFDITVLMSPGDVWNANITRDAAGIARLTTADRTCTLPNVVNSTFVTARLGGTPAQNAQSTTEGYIEVFNMADIPPNGSTDATLFGSIKHVSGVPRNCNSTAVNTLFTDPADLAAATAAGLAAPTTGLSGSWTVLNGPAGASWADVAVAVEARIGASDLPGFGNIVFFPQANVPVSLASARANTADPILRGGVADSAGTIGTPGTPPVAALQFDFPDMSTPYLNADLGAGYTSGASARRQAYRLSRALAVSSVSNEYVTGSGILATTDWSLSSPTRRYNVARNYATAPASNLYTNFALDDANAPPATVLVPPGGLAVVPTNYYSSANVSVATPTAQPYGVICVTGNTFANGSSTPAALSPNNLISGQTTDTEERFATTSNDFVISPGTPTVQRSLCGEVSILSFNAPAPAQSTLNAQLTRFDLTSIFAAGWTRINTPGLTVAGANQGLGGSTRAGLPIIGNSFVQFTNNNAAAGGAADRTIGNYDQTLRHRSTRY